MDLKDVALISELSVVSTDFQQHHLGIDFSRY